MKLSGLEKRFLGAVGLISLLCIGLFVVRVAATHTSHYWFLVQNLGLAWLPLRFVWLLRDELKRRRWLSWQCLSLTLLWVVFLPNTWYVLTDFLHVQPTGEINQLYDIVMVSSLVLAGFVLGFTSLYLMHKELLKKFRVRTAHTAVLAILLLSSFAIYLGRDLRWNSWDVITNPSGLILNVSDRVVDPFGYHHAFNVTGLFFVLLTITYLAIWLLLRPLKNPKP